MHSLAMHALAHALALLLSLCGERSVAIRVEGGQTHGEADVDPDEYLWEKLPGRCCFYGVWHARLAIECRRLISTEKRLLR